MTDSFVSPELLAAIPFPWRLADSSRRVKAMEDLSPGPEQQAAAVSTLTACLAYGMDMKARYGDEPDWGLPDGFFGDYFFILHGTLVEWMPTLADVTREKVRDWAEKNVDAGEMFGADWTVPPDDFIENVGQMWVASIVNGAADNLIRWFRQVARDHLGVFQRTQVVELLKQATPRLPWRRAIITIPAILDLGGPVERDYFDRLANDAALHERTREEAASKRWLIDREANPDLERPF